MQRLTHDLCLIGALAALSLGVSACSSDDSKGDGGGSSGDPVTVGNSGDDDDDAKGAAGSSSGGETVLPSGGGISLTDDDDTAVPTAPSTSWGGPSCSGLPFTEGEAADGSVCTGLQLEAEGLDVDVYIMMDKSVSMDKVLEGGSVSRWEGVREALRAFVDDDEAASTGIGIQFFNQSGGATESIDCDPASYATPNVEIGAASEVGGDIVDAIDEQALGGLTPTLPALEGAIMHARAWKEDHPNRETVVVLVTDGYPTMCQDPVSIQDIAEVAADGFSGEPSIRTFTVGLAAGLNLNAIARSGGTGEAYIVSEGDVTEAFLGTLLNLSNTNLACNFEIPPVDGTSEEVDPELVQVLYHPNVGDSEEIPRVQSSAYCSTGGHGGWFWLDTAQTQIGVCPCTCSRFAAGSVEVRAGCRPSFEIT